MRKLELPKAIITGDDLSRHLLQFLYFCNNDGDNHTTLLTCVILFLCKKLNIVFKLTLKLTLTTQCSSVSVIVRPMSIILDTWYSILYSSRLLNHVLRILFKLHIGRKRKLEHLKDEDAVTYWQSSYTYYLSFEDVANVRNLYHVLQTRIQSLTCAKTLNLPMSVTSTFCESVFNFLC